MSSSSNTDAPPKVVAQLIGSTLLLVGVNLAILIVVLLPPKKKFVEGVVLFVGDPPVVLDSDTVGVGSCRTSVGLNWGSRLLSLSTNASRKELQEAQAQVGKGFRTAGLGEVIVRILPPLPASLRPVNSVDPNPSQLVAVECGFIPRFLAIGTNEPLRLVNSNATSKTLVSVSHETNPMIHWTPSKLGQLETARFSREEFFVRVQQADNAAVYGVIGVMGHPYYAVVDADGVFRLPGGLPDEDFTLEAIHPTLGRREIRVQPRRPAGPLVIRFGAE